MRGVWILPFKGTNGHSTEVSKVKRSEGSAQCNSGAFSTLMGKCKALRQMERSLDLPSEEGFFTQTFFKVLPTEVAHSHIARVTVCDPVLRNKLRNKLFRVCS